MNEEKTLGQIAFEAYWKAYGYNTVRPFTEQFSSEFWECAAKAVLDASRTIPAPAGQVTEWDVAGAADARAWGWTRQPGMEFRRDDGEHGWVHVCGRIGECIFDDGFTYRRPKKSQPQDERPIAAHEVGEQPVASSPGVGNSPPEAGAETPLTDDFGAKNISGHWHIDMKSWRDFARQLERSLAAKDEEIARLKEENESRGNAINSYKIAVSSLITERDHVRTALEAAKEAEERCAKLESQLSEARKGGGWIAFSERRPTKEDANSNGEVLFEFGDGNITSHKWDESSIADHWKGRASHWMPILPLPQPVVPVDAEKEWTRIWAAIEDVMRSPLVEFKEEELVCIKLDLRKKFEAAFTASRERSAS
jgi:hypothetical protein